MSAERLIPPPTSADGTASAERIHGISEPLPPGERVLWQGTPAPLSLGRRAFHANAIVIWFAVLAVWQIASTRVDGATWSASFGSALSLTGPLVAGVLIVLGIGMWSAYTSTYAITDRRVVMRVGMVLPITFNVPLGLVERASVRRYRDGTGDIALALSGNDRLAYAVLWPHARGWKFRRPEPSLRCIADLEAAAQALGSALAAQQEAAQQQAAVAVVADRPEAALPAATPAGELAGVRPRGDVALRSPSRPDDRAVPVAAGGHA